MYKTIKILIVCLVITSCSSSRNAFKKSFSLKETALIMNSDSLKPMRVYKINNINDSLLLRKKSAYIKPNSKDLVLKTFINRLYATVRNSSSLGVGIAAPQVGILKNIIWVQRFDKEEFPFEVYLNPKIVSYSEKKQTVKEGCLSIPNRSETLDSRSLSITIDYDTMNSEHKTETVSGFTSVIFQHEIDHLNGILYLDHLKKDIKNTGP
ncbi:peptide deformylase [Algibacter amylolyticus]|uniref:Peptide deformylase n=2 Tax=Algibacter amylolyticus TaxID=1608400 RepID=A0A5M7BA52_9FLAO|nr:peptide deformylase [Algibacter amylolyticus]TSJ80337.1 peptide deformylase [Algibacter amylolyticus]